MSPWLCKTDRQTKGKPNDADQCKGEHLVVVCDGEGEDEEANCGAGLGQRVEYLPDQGINIMCWIIFAGHWISFDWLTVLINKSLSEKEYWTDLVWLVW